MNWKNAHNPEFSSALLNIEQDVPEGIIAWHGGAVKKRFQVYRNNVYISLVDVIAAQFPVCVQFVGEEFFKAVAREYVAKNMPKNPKMFEYGENFPEFLDEFAPAKAAPMLPDLARFEWAWNLAYHAAEAGTINGDDLAHIAPEFMQGLCFTFHPSFQLFHSHHPIVDLWLAHKNDVTGGLQLPDEAQYAIIVRPEAHVQVIPIAQTQFEFIAALKSGKTLEAAMNGQDPQICMESLAILLGQGCLSDYTIQTDGLI